MARTKAQGQSRRASTASSAPSSRSRNTRAPKAAAKVATKAKASPKAKAAAVKSMSKAATKAKAKAAAKEQQSPKKATREDQTVPVTTNEPEPTAPPGVPPAWSILKFATVAAKRNDHDEADAGGGLVSDSNSKESKSKGLASQGYDNDNLGDPVVRAGITSPANDNMEVDSNAGDKGSIDNGSDAAAGPEPELTAQTVAGADGEDKVAEPVAPELTVQTVGGADGEDKVPETDLQNHQASPLPSASKTKASNNDDDAATPLQARRASQGTTPTCMRIPPGQPDPATPSIQHSQDLGSATFSPPQIASAVKPEPALAEPERRATKALRLTRANLDLIQKLDSQSHSSQGQSTKSRSRSPKRVVAATASAKASGRKNGAFAFALLRYTGCTISSYSYLKFL